MQTFEQNLEPRALTDAELDQISGGGILSRIGNFLRSIFSGPKSWPPPRLRVLKTPRAASSRRRPASATWCCA